MHIDFSLNLYREHLKFDYERGHGGYFNISVIMMKVQYKIFAQHVFNIS